MMIEIDWELKLSEGFEDLTQEQKNIILEAIIRDIQNYFIDGSIGIEVEEK